MLDIILRFLFISIPEEAFIAFLYIGLTKQYGILEKVNRYKLAAMVVIPSVLMNILRYLQINENINLISCMLSYYILMSAFILEGAQKRIYQIKKVLLKNLLWLIITFIIFMISEIPTLLVMMRVLGQTIQEINSNILVAIFATLLERAVQWVLLYFMFFSKLGKKFNEITVNINDVFKFIRYSRIASVVAIILLIAAIPTLIFIGYQFVANDILVRFNRLVQIGLCTALVLIPSAIIALLLEFSRISVLNTKAYTYTLANDVREQAIHALKCAKSGDKGEAEEAIMGIINALDFAEDE